MKMESKSNYTRFFRRKFQRKFENKYLSDEEILKLLNKELQKLRLNEMRNGKMNRL
jgi:hypothetical protein